MLALRLLVNSFFLYLLLQIKNMKHFFALFMLFFLGTVAYAQQKMEDVIYTKDGGSVRGEIMKTSDSAAFRVQTKDGSVFVVKISDVEKVTKERVKYGNLYIDKTSRYKSSGIGLITTSGVLMLAGGCTMGVGMNRDWIGPGRFLAGISLLCLSTPFLISGSVMLAKYSRHKKAQKTQPELSFMPDVQMHRMDGLTQHTVAPVTSVGLKMQFRF